MIVAIIGLGLIGGSMARVFRNQQFATRLIGVDQSEVHAQEALELGLVDEIQPLEEAVAQAGLVMVAIPVDATKKVLPIVLDQLKPDAVVMDAGSTKSGICEAVAEHANRRQFVASHPIAGTENFGPKAAIDDLFQGKMTIICEIEKNPPKVQSLAMRVYHTLEMQIVFMNPKEHDLHVAYVSHLSHISSFTLGLTVLEIEKSEKAIFELAGSGFASTVRLAKSSSRMWGPIFMQNADHLSKALNAYIENLQQFKALIDAGEVDKLYELMDEANDIRRILDKPQD